MTERCTNKEKFDEATRELGMRLRYYPSMVERGVNGMTEAIAEKRIRIMREMAEDYAKLAALDEPKFI